MLDDIGNHFLDHAVDLVKSGRKFVYVVDNIDWEEKVRDMRAYYQNKSVHACATSMVFNRVSSDHLPVNGPQKDIATCNFQEIVSVSDEEMGTIRSRYKVFIARILVQKFTELLGIKPYIPEDLVLHENSEKTALKSEIIILPVLMKDEKKYSDYVDVLDQLEQWAEDLYKASGMYNFDQSSSTALIVQVPTRPDQPRSHIPPVGVQTDPLQGVKIPCFGDELTRVRFAGARDLRSGCHTPKQRLDHLYPYRIVGWHAKRSFLKVNFKISGCRYRILLLHNFVVHIFPYYNFLI